MGKTSRLYLEIVIDLLGKASNQKTSCDVFSPASHFRLQNAASVIVFVQQKHNLQIKKRHIVAKKTASAN